MKWNVNQISFLNVQFEQLQRATCDGARALMMCMFACTGVGWCRLRYWQVRCVGVPCSRHAKWFKYAPFGCPLYTSCKARQCGVKYGIWRACDDVH